MAELGMQSATVAMLFSDIEGSTRLLQQLGESYGGMLAEHHALMRDAFARHAGAEQSTEGDSFFVLFPTAPDAVGAALDAQLALAAHDWPDGAPVRVRMGIHVGAVKTIAGTIVGMAVHEGARIGAAAHGGQVLASARAAELAGDVASWRDLGSHELKDIAAPIALRQLNHAALRDEFPPPRSQGSSRNNLPAQASAFLGRQREVDEVTELLATTRVLTLTGAGGAGKSRLALRVAADAGVRFADGVFFVDLAPISEADGIGAQIGEALGLTESATGDIANAIGQRSILLVVDNCEHLIAAVAGIVGDIVTHCPGAVVMATSREPLGIGGEAVWRVPSLSDDEAVALFCARAKAANPQFDLTELNRDVVADICTRLDAIPLALELAAGRLGSLGIDQLAARLNQRFRLLTGGSRSGLARQRTLQATVDWSYELLEPPEQAVLRRLGVFVGGVSLEAAEAACVDNTHGIDAADVLDHLDALVAKSLLVAEHHDGVVRYRLLETIRQYALDKLVTHGSMAAARDAHAAWVVTLSEDVEQQLWSGGPDEVPTMRRLTLESANIRAAVDWLIESGQLPDAITLTSRISPWQLATGRVIEMQQWAQRLGNTDLSEGDRALAAFIDLVADGNMGGFRDVGVVARLCDDIPAIASSTRPEIAAGALAYRALVMAITGLLDTDEAMAQIDEAIADPAITPFAQTMVWQSRSQLLAAMQQLEPARVAARQGFDVIKGRGFAMAESRLAYVSADMAIDAGDLDDAWRWSEQGLAAAKVTGDVPMLIAIQQELAVVQGLRGDLRGAADLLLGALAAAIETQVDWEIAPLQARIAWYLMLDGDVEAGDAYARRGAELALPDARGFECFIVACEAARLVGDVDRAREMLARAHDALGAVPDHSRAAALFDRGATLRLEAGDYAGAARLFAAAAATRPATSAMLPASRERLAQLIERTRAGMGNESDFAAAWAEGSTMTLAEATELSVEPR